MFDTEYPPIVLDITVKNGFGYLPFLAKGKIVNVSIVPPKDLTAKYKLFSPLISETDGHPRWAEEKQSGPSSYEVRIPVFGDHHFAILDAEVDGKYQVKLWRST